MVLLKQQIEVIMNMSISESTPYEGMVMKSKTKTPLMKINIIWSFEGREQQMSDIDMKNIPIDLEETNFVRDLIFHCFPDDYETATPYLYKMSMCLSFKEKGIENIPFVKKVLARNAKYYFDENQRDDVENEIVGMSLIASKLSY